MTKITEYLEILLEGGDLKYEQAKDLLDTIFKGDVAEVQIAAFLAAMRMKKATPERICRTCSIPQRPRRKGQHKNYQSH